MTAALKTVLVVAVMAIAVRLSSAKDQGKGNDAMNASMSKSFKARLYRLSARVKPWRQTEEREIRKALKETRGDKVVAAALLDISKTTIYRKLEDYGWKNPFARQRR